MAEARLLLTARRYDDARRLAYQLSAQAPGDPAPLLLAARAEMALGRPREAEEAASQAIGLDPDSAEGHRVLARALISNAMKQPFPYRRDLAGRALASAREALRLAPADIDALLAAAEAAAWARRFPEAVAAVDEAVRLLPRSEQVWFTRARVARLAGDLPVAESAAREALRLAPDFYAANNELGLILSAKGDRAGARERFVASASIDPIAAPARVNLVRQRNAWWVYLLCLLVTSPLLVVAELLKAPSVAFLGWVLLSVALREKLLRWGPVTQRLQHRSVAKAGKGIGEPPRARRPRTSQSSPAAPIRRRHSVRTSLLVALTVVMVPVAIGVTVAMVAVPTQTPMKVPQTLAVLALPDILALACVVSLARRLRGPKVFGGKADVGGKWQTTR